MNDEFFKHVEMLLPDLCLPKDLIRCGLFNSLQNAHLARKEKRSPPYYRIGRRIIYPKKGVLEWMRRNGYGFGK
jgi:hypothetical protein